MVTSLQMVGDAVGDVAAHCVAAVPARPFGWTSRLRRSPACTAVIQRASQARIACPETAGTAVTLPQILLKR
ncbi:hypothetical protein Aph02nite_78940 [Actinoplanes philippinensis]|nr:hypothetical protein Aph02nite_78940 [Actinoplanes philippinensis]